MAEPNENAPSGAVDPSLEAERSASVANEVDLELELAEARTRADEHYRSWQRSAADFANFKRRVDDEKRFAERWLMQDLLSVLDDFERAWATVPRELLRLSWLEGVLQINSRVMSILQQHGLSRIEATGKDFSPLEHEAVMREEESDPSEQTAVIAELQAGYRLHERVLRPTLVKVGKPQAGAEGAQFTPQPDSEPPGDSSASGSSDAIT